MKMISTKPVPDVVTTKVLSDLLHCSRTTALVYLGRPEFSHIEQVMTQRQHIFKGVTPRDVELLRRLIFNRKRKSGKIKC